MKERVRVGQLRAEGGGNLLRILHPAARPRLQSQRAVGPFSCKRGKEIGEIGPKLCRVYTCTAFQGRFCVNAAKSNADLSLNERYMDPE